MTHHGRKSKKIPSSAAASDATGLGVHGHDTEAEALPADADAGTADENRVPDLNAGVEQIATAVAVEAVAVPDNTRARETAPNAVEIFRSVSTLGAAPASMARAKAAYEDMLNVFGRTSQVLPAALDGTGVSATKLAFKLAEFAQANVRSSFDFAWDCATVRSLPDALEAQTAFTQRQLQLLTAQIEELRAITTEMAAVTGAPFTKSATRV